MTPERIADIREQHRKNPHLDYTDCSLCFEEYPCEVIEALDAHDALTEQLARVTAERDSARQWSAAWKASAQLHRQSGPHWQAQLTRATEFIAEQGAARNALSARLEAVTAALQIAEDNSRIQGSPVGWCCVICDQCVNRLPMNHAPDCPFTILAAGQTAPAEDPASDEPHCTENRHIVLPSGEACVCGDNRTELLL